MTEIHDSYEAYGCEVNALDVDDLFRKYEQSGFLYTDKMKRLAPFWSLIHENWKSSLRGGELIHYVVSTKPDAGGWASLSSWRSTENGWNSQHLSGIGGPKTSRAVMLSAQAVRIKDQFDKSHQNWFQRSNRFANKIFGSIEQTLGATCGWVGDYGHLFCPPPPRLSQKEMDKLRCRPCLDADSHSICQLANSLRSPVYAAAEELEFNDLSLQSVDDLYRKVGLRRYRRVLIADLGEMDMPAGVALAYRGPLGLNFSFLENRCDLLINPALEEEQKQGVVEVLLSSVAEHYSDFELQIIPVVVDRVNVEFVRKLGGELIRDYSQSVWLREGYANWYRHVEKIYERVMRAERHHELGEENARPSTIE